VKSLANAHAAVPTLLAVVGVLILSAMLASLISA
jgi:hypothetical protein